MLEACLERGEVAVRYLEDAAGGLHDIAVIHCGGKFGLDEPVRHVGIEHVHQWQAADGRTAGVLEAVDGRTPFATIGAFTCGGLPLHIPYGSGGISFLFPFLFPFAAGDLGGITLLPAFLFPFLP